MRDAQCSKCDGCGKVANTEDQEPWTVWQNLPVGSAAAVLTGTVRPIDCNVCNGTGKIDSSNKEELYKNLLHEAVDVMEDSYDVRDWPGPDGAMWQLVTKIRAVLEKE